MAGDTNGAVPMAKSTKTAARPAKRAAPAPATAIPSRGLWRRLPPAWRFVLAVGGALGAILATAGVGWAARVLYTDRASAAELGEVRAQLEAVAVDVAELARQGSAAAEEQRRQAAELRELRETAAELRAGVRLLIEGRAPSPKGGIR
jgi:hypothetical protein